MKKMMSLLFAISAFSTTVYGVEKASVVTNMGSVKGGDSKTAYAIMNKKCSKCHSTKIIDAALKENKDMFKIQQSMEKRGAKLSSKEREVLGIFWNEQNPLKQGK